MSSTLYWKPTAAKGDLPDALKYKLREEYQLPRVFDAHDIPFLRGLKACGVDGADKLISLLEKYGELEVFERS